MGLQSLFCWIDLEHGSVRDWVMYGLDERDRLSVVGSGECGPFDLAGDLAHDLVQPLVRVHALPLG
jgi:hypothetical protein